MCRPTISRYCYPYTFYQNSSCNPFYSHPDKFTQKTFDHCVAEKINPPFKTRLTIKSAFSENHKKYRKTERYKERKPQTIEYSLEDQIKKVSQPRPLSKDLPEFGGYLMNENETKNWKDEKPISDYPLNIDENKTLVTLENEKNIDKIKRIDIKYLEPTKSRKAESYKETKSQTTEYSFEDQIKKGGEPRPLPKDARFVPEFGGYLMNENETKNWKGELPISDYPLNIDENPTIVTLDHEKTVDKIKRIDIKYLEPTKLPPGKLIIKREANHFVKEAPPVIIRVPATKRTPTPPTLIHRERPPTRPQTIDETIRIPGEAIILPRRVITEQLAKEPSNPQSEIYETWKPYETREIEVVYEPEQNFLDFNQNSTMSKKNVVNFSFNVSKFNEFMSPLTKDLANNGLNLDALNSVVKIDWKNVVHSEIIKCLLKAYMF